MNDFKKFNSDDKNNKNIEWNTTKKFLLTESKKFCILPWIHLHVFPNGNAWPCCMADQKPGPVGNAQTQTLKELWNSNKMQEIRKNMLNETSNDHCTRCYEQENSGFFSMRYNANKHHGHHIEKIKNTSSEGYLNDFQIVYWDIRFSNLCNLKCRSCGHIFSSQWYQDQLKLSGPQWSKRNKILNIAGRNESDMWNQLLPHIDYVEQIYFAGGEPLLMEEHYRILDELVKRSMFHVKLVYNTNFTHTNFKEKSVFEYWKLFDSVLVGASLDGAENYAEYIRKGCNWKTIEQNRFDMLKICPNVDFYVNPTLSILNAWHLPDFHRNWVERGFIMHQDLNINILQDPLYYRIDIAPKHYKNKLEEKYLQHIEWLKDKDPIQRATIGFKSAINFMQSTDNSHLIDTFWKKTNELDLIRQEKVLDIIPELNFLL